MPQQKSPTSANRTSSPGRRPNPAGRRRSTTSSTRTGQAQRSEEQESGASESLGDQLLRFLDPRELVVLTRDRLQEVLDDAVERGRMTRADASLLVAELVHRGRKQTEDLVADVEQVLGRSRSQIEGTADRVRREVDRARRVAGLGTPFPIQGYDELTAAQVTARLAELTPAELRQVRDYESRNANRKTVLAAIEQRLG